MTDLVEITRFKPDIQNGRTRASWLTVCLLMIGALAAGFASPASASYSFANSQVVAKAKSYPIGYNGGQCRVWAGNVINGVLAANGIQAQVGGYRSSGGAYYGAYANAGGSLVSASAAQPGDLVQIINASQKNMDYPTGRLHTAIIVGATSTAGTFVVRDSNWNFGDERVSQHNLNPVTWAAAKGATAYFWRFGTVRGSAGPAGSGVSTVATSDGHIQVFTTGSGIVRQNWYSSRNGQVGGWTQSAGVGAQAVGTPALVVRGGQSVVDIFVRGGDGRIYETWYNWGTGAWGGWIGMGGSVSSDPQAVATSDGHIQVFATGNGLVVENWFSPGNGAIGGWISF